MSMLVVGDWGEPRRRLVDRRWTRVLDWVGEPPWLLRVGVVVRPRGKRGNMSVSEFFRDLRRFQFFFFFLPRQLCPFR